MPHLYKRVFFHVKYISDIHAIVGEDLYAL
jgi:hypothetical protein